MSHIASLAFELWHFLKLGFCHSRFRTAIFLLTAPSAWSAVDSPITPDAAIQTFQLDKELSIELVAAEPLTTSPVALAWDDEERLFVVENRGYPTGMPDGTAGGRVAMLVDTNADGRMDQRTLFADDFSFPNGILPWDGGVFVTCAPDLFFLKDTTGDGQADLRQVVLTGFDTRSSTQLRVAHPTLGPDGWIYLTSGLARAGKITSPLHPERPPVTIGTDARFNPATYEIEPIDGRGQFGQTFDDWGNRFHCMNRVHIQHTVVPSWFLKRNPDLAFNETVQNVPEGMLDDLLKSKNVAARIYPISDNLTTADSHAGTFSAACGVHLYRGDNLPPDYYGDVFACDPTGNLVHRDRLTAIGPTFSSHMVNEGREFLASRDNWFRPVFLATGPDGAIYVADMYRLTIEHPDYLPEELRKRTDFDSGRDLGRIWRICSKTSGSRRPRNENVSTDPARASVSPIEKTINDLGHPNVWQRERAMRLLIANTMTNALPMLLDKLPQIEGKNDNEYFRNAHRQERLPRRDLLAVAKINALNTAVALSNWDFRKPGEDQPPSTSPPEQIRQLVQRIIAMTVDKSPAVRLTAFRHLRLIGPPGLDVAGEIIGVWSDDPNPAVRFQAGLTFGNWDGGSATKALARIALRDGENKWARAAFLSGIHGRETEIMNAVLRHPASPPPPELAHQLGRYFGRKQRGIIRVNGIHRTVDWSDAEAAWQISALSGMMEGVGLREFLTGDPPGLLQLGFSADQQTAIAGHARRLIGSGEKNSIVPRSAATVLATMGERVSQQLFDLLGPATSPDLALHALGLLIEAGDPAQLDRLTSEPVWRSLSPTARSIAIDAFLLRTESADVLWQAIEAEHIQASALSLSQRDRLKKRVSSQHRESADQLFAQAGGDRMRVYREMKEVASLPGDPANGQLLFRQHCASCHRLDREGFSVGPDLFGIRNQPKEAILLHILIPNQEVYPGFAAVTIETSDDRSLTGIIRSENDNSVTLVQAQGLEETLPRSAILSLTTGTVSLMPDGFEQVTTRQGMADLLACLKGEQ